MDKSGLRVSFSGQVYRVWLSTFSSGWVFSIFGLGFRRCSGWRSFVSAKIISTKLKDEAGYDREISTRPFFDRARVRDISIEGRASVIFGTSEVEESGVVYVWSGAPAFRLSTSGSIYQDLRTPAIFINNSGLKRYDRWNFRRQDTAVGTLSIGFFRADHRTPQI